MPTNQQRREAAKRKLDRQLARRAERATRRRRRYAMASGAAVVVLVLGLVALIVSLDTRHQSAATKQVASSGTGAAAKPNPDPRANPGTKQNSDTQLAAEPVRPRPLPASVDCQYPATQQTPARPVRPPLAGPTSTAGTVRVSMQTSAGMIGLTLDRALAPCTVTSFASLAKQGFYANTPCHRLVTNPGLHVLQCGDPTGSGAGGPGYTIPDEVFPELTYGRGLVAMANTGQPDSGGSQFFLIYGQTQLPPQYTVFATISPAGLAVLGEIAKAGDDGSLEPSPGGGKPNKPVTITSIDIAAS